MICNTVELSPGQISVFLDQLSNGSGADPQQVNTYLARVDSLDYDTAELILDHVQTQSAAFIVASALQRKLERTTRIPDDDVTPYQRRILARLGRYLIDAPIVALKIISIAALLAIHALPSGSNPIKIFTFLLSGGNLAPEDDTITPFDYTLLNNQDILIILTFAQSLIEQVPNVKFSRIEQMKSIKPLCEASEDLAWIMRTVLQQRAWEIPLVRQVLRCYRAWVEYAVVHHEVKIQVLFPNLAEIFNVDVGPFFRDAGTLQVAAEVFGDIAEWSSLPKTTSQTIIESIVSTDLIQNVADQDFDAFSALASLAITLCESMVSTILDPLTPGNAKMLEIMLFLLDSEISTRTFNFWISFAESCVDIGNGHQGDPWLERALAILLQRSAWRELDRDEWAAYRMDVVELFEGICDVLGNEKINSVVLECLETAAQRGNFNERMIILEATLFFVLSVKNEFTLTRNVQERVFQWIFEILDHTPPITEPAILLHKTVLNFFVPYSRSLDVYKLSHRALDACRAATLTPELSPSAARAINKIIKTLPITDLDIPVLIHGLHQILSLPMNIVDQTIVLEGYVFLFASSLPNETIPGVIEGVLGPLINSNLQHCNQLFALNGLKLTFAAGKTLYTTEPGKLYGVAWTQGTGKRMSDWVKHMVEVFMRRFGNDFEIVEVITEILQFSIVNGRGLLTFSREEITEFIKENLSEGNAINSNTSTLIISLAAFLTKFYSSKSQVDITDEVDVLFKRFTTVLLPNLDFLRPEKFHPSLLEQPLAIPFKAHMAANPEVFFQAFDFLGQTIPRYSKIWTGGPTLKWMFCILLGVGMPEGGMAYQGSIDFLTNLVKKVLGHRTPAPVQDTFEYFREAIFAQIIKTISLPAPSTALPSLSSLLSSLLKTKPKYPRMWLDLLERYVIKGPQEDRQKFCRSAMRYLNDRAVLEIVKEWWTACH